jgi:hypothetical protein
MVTQTRVYFGSGTEFIKKGNPVRASPVGIQGVAVEDCSESEEVALFWYVVYDGTFQ